MNIEKTSFFMIKNSPQITKLEFYLNPNFNKYLNIPLDIDVIIDRQDDTELNKNENIVTLELQIFTDKNINQVPFILNTKIQGVFKWKQNKDIVIIEKLLNQNAPAILYSYLRPIVSNMTLQAGLPPLTLPIMNFTQNNSSNI